MRKGFFSAKEKKQIGAAVKLLPSCNRCTLKRNCISPNMMPLIKGKGKRILFLGEAPGKEEDEKGEPFIGSSGKLLKSFLNKLGIEDYIFYNAVNCRPSNNRTPTGKEIEYCRPNVLQLIMKEKPKVIMPLGEIALRSLLEYRIKGGVARNQNPFAISKWEGWEIPEQEFDCWIVPNFHPAYILRCSQDLNASVINKHFVQNIKKAKRLLRKEIPTHSFEVIQLTGTKAVIHILEKILAIEEEFALCFDYETTGLKPQDTRRHSIVSCAFSVSENRAYAFMMNDVVAKKWRLILKKRNIHKIAHNLKFEEIWSRVILKVHCRPWLWDSMLAAHVLDNRAGIVSLKFQSYVNFGVADYDSHIHYFLNSKEKNANGVNQVKQIPPSELLEYNGFDAVLEYKLAKKQMEKMHQSTDYFVDIDEEYLTK